jgi:hypothetical protein
MLALLLPARWPAMTVLLLAVIALVIVATILGGQTVDDVGSWRWPSGRPV